MSKRRTVLTAVATVALAAPLIVGMGQTASAATSGSTDPLGADCSGSALPPHTGFQIAPACVATSFGEVTEQAKDASLLIVDAPKKVNIGQSITLKVSTRNLVRDRFLAAGAGGYYKESSFLTADGLTRGHFHTACRMLTDAVNAPPPDRQAIFKATEDGGGGATPDTVTVTVGGLPHRGTAQCAVWAGDGSHRVPMMQFANQIPAFDAVRIKVGDGD